MRVPCVEADALTPVGWSRSSESLFAHIVGRKDDHDGNGEDGNGKRHTPEQVVRKLTQADRLLAEGKEVSDVCRDLQGAEQTYYRWRNQFGG